MRLYFLLLSFPLRFGPWPNGDDNDVGINTLSRSPSLISVVKDVGINKNNNDVVKIPVFDVC